MPMDSVEEIEEDNVDSDLDDNTNIEENMKHLK
jgi:hypothetical protein